MEPYLSLLRDICANGKVRPCRAILKSTGQPVDTLSVFGRQVRFDLSQRFPAVTTKKLFFKGVVHELLWFLQGSTNISYLKRNGVNIWDEWANEYGELGPVYGSQWRSWQDYDGHTIDQIANVIQEIKTNPHSRRLIVSAWNVADLPAMALPPCHLLFQFYVQDEKLSCQLYQRSADAALGAPFNIAAYSLLTCMIAQVTGLQPGEFIHTFGDLHIYTNHLEQVELQLSREPFPAPRLWLNPAVKHIDEFRFEDIRLENYQSHPAIAAEVAV